MQDESKFFGVDPSVWRTRGVWLVLLLGGLILFAGTGQLPLFDRDEPRFAGATREMIQRGEWIIPYFNGEYRFDKPVLTYWLMRVGYTICGQNEMGARLHGIAFTLATAVAIFSWGRRWFSATAGALAAIFWVTCLQVQIHGRLAVADMPMIFFLVMAQGALWEMLQVDQRSKRWTWFIVFYSSLGLGFLAKGPLVLAVPFLTLLAYRFWSREKIAWSRLDAGLGLPLVVLLVAVWGIPALVETQGLFWKVGMMEHVVERGAVPLAGGHFFLPVYYELTVFFSLFPWVVFLPEAWGAVRQRGPGIQSFLASWVVTVYVIFFFYRTQLPHYVMPAFPALFWLMAQGLMENRPPSRAVQIWRWSLAGIFGVVVLVAFILLEGGGINHQGVAWQKLARGILAVLGGGLVWVLSIRGTSPKRAILGTALVLLGWSQLGESLRALHPVVALASKVESLGPEVELRGEGFLEPSLVFYTGRPLKSMSEEGPAIRIRLLQEADLGRWVKAAWKREPVTPKILATPVAPSLGERTFFLEGVNIGRTSWVRLQVTAPR
jgi:4-amino-4-deoxy-L-arabinose transferase-like glycosyltransferase